MLYHLTYNGWTNQAITLVEYYHEKDQAVDKNIIYKSIVHVIHVTSKSNLLLQIKSKVTLLDGTFPEKLFKLHLSLIIKKYDVYQSFALPQIWYPTKCVLVYKEKPDV